MRQRPPVHTQRLIDFQCIASRFISLGYAIREFGREGYRSCPAILSDDRRRRSRVNLTISTQRLICFKYFTTLIKSKFNESKSFYALFNFKKNWVEQIAKKTSRIRYSFQLSVPLFILFNFIAFTSHAQSFVDAKQSGKDLANSLLGQVQNNVQQDINNKNPMTDTSVAESINYKGTDIPEKNYTNDNMDAAKNQKAADKNNTEASIVSTSFLRAKEYPISLSDSFLDKANDAQKNPENYVDWLSGKYTDCNQEGGEEVLSKSSHTCDEFKEIKDNICSVGRSIQVDSKHKYICPRKINKFEKVCNKVLTVSIERGGNCDSGAIKYQGYKIDYNWWGGTSPAAGGLIANWNYSYPNILINVSKTGYGSCNGTKSTISFEVTNVSLLQSFTLNSLTYRGVFIITINNHRIHAGLPTIATLDSDYYYCKDLGGPHHWCKCNSYRWGVEGSLKSTPLDLKAFLKSGTNIIEIETVALGNPELKFVIDAKQDCFKEVDIWSEKCSEAAL